MSVDMVRVGDILELQRRAVEVEPSRTYEEIGVRSFGKGLFIKPLVTGAEIGGKRVFYIEPGDLVISNVFGWEGAVAVAGEEHAGKIGSHRFMTWTPSRPGVDVRSLQHYLLSEPGLASLQAASPGSAGRNRTLSITNFEAIRVPLTDMATQLHTIDYLDHLAATAHNFGVIRRRQTGTLDRALLPELLRRILVKSTTRWCTLSELCTNTVRTIHPGDDRRGAEQFIGLEHIESHTGRRLGCRPVGDEKGRKLLFREGEVLFGYLRPYLNKVWVTDRTGLCSVEQYALIAAAGVNAELLGYVLRSAVVLDSAVAATHSLQLPRLRVDRLMEIKVPDIRAVVDIPETVRLLNESTQRVIRLAELTLNTRALTDGIPPAARNEVFSALLR